METKKCTKCLQELPLEAFRWKNKALGKKHSQCKECQKKQEKIHYQESSTRRASIKETAKFQKENNFVLVENFKRQGCQKCGEKRLIALDCHHIDKKQKVLDIAQMIKSASEETLILELEKCIVLCANCHREFHYLEHNNGTTLEQYLSPEFTNLLEI